MTLPAAPFSLPPDWPDLPIAGRRGEIAEAIRANQVIVVCGETGSGKTTQLPKICLDIGRSIIGHTQPRRLAARTVAQRIADELNTPLGQIVGYKIRFNDITGRDTRIKLMTDGVLLNETQTDRDLRRYDTLIIDEAHERSLNIDFLLGYIKRLLPRRPDLKVILTSATIDPQRFSRHFNDAPIIMVEGRTYPVETRYRPLAMDERDADSFPPPLAGGGRGRGPEGPSSLNNLGEQITSGPNGGSDPQGPSGPLPPPPPARGGGEEDADLTELQGVVEAVHELIRENRGDVLVFLPTERDIRETAEALEGEHFNADILPLYSRLSAAEQIKVFRPDGKRRRIILSTNVAETSVTVPGIHCVIDTGLARVSRYSTRTKVQRLPIEPISQASADQRKGRCGRVAPGVCVRLYSEKDFSERERYAEPEILRTNLAAVILQMKWLRLGDIERFPFIDPPDSRQVRDGLATLHEIGAIDEADELTPIGKRLAKLPVDPRVGRMIIGGQDEECVEDVLVIAAALSTQDVRERPADKQTAADQAHASFRDPQSDFISLLKLWREMRMKQAEVSNGQFRKWCRANFLSYLRYREWTDVHHQLCDILQVRPWSDRANAIRPVAQQDGDPFSPKLRDAVHRSLLGGLLSNIAVKADAATYTGARGTKLSIWPGSTLFKARPPWIVSAELVETTKLYSRTVAPVRVEWIERAARHLLKRTYTEPHWVKQSGHVHAFEKVTLFGLLLVAKRSVHYGPVDPPVARQLFVHHALVLGEFRTDHPALLTNQAHIAEVERWQEKLRRRDLLSDQQSRFSYFDQRVPPHVYSGPTFDEWAKRGLGSNSHELELPDELLLREGVTDELVTQFGARVMPEAGKRIASLRETLGAQFPDTLNVQDLKLPLEYRFDPGEDADGLTAVVPLNVLPQLPVARAEWLVPGVVRPKIDALVRSLPKRLRTLFVPVNQAVDSVITRLPPFGVGSFIDAVAGALWKIGGDPVVRDDFQADHVPPHLMLNFRVLDAAGAALAEGRDLSELRLKLGQQVRESYSSLADPRFTRDDLKAWDFGDLPARVEIEQHGARLFGYPALIEYGETAQLRLLDSQESADLLMPGGLQRLFMIELAREMKTTLRDLPGLEALRLSYRPFGTGDELMADLSRLVANRALLPRPIDIRTQAQFAAKAHLAWGRLYETSRAIGKLAAEIIERTRVLNALLSRPYPPLLVDNVDDMRQQLAALVPKRFLSELPGDRVEQLPRYLRGIESRLTKLQNAGLSKDLTGLGIVRPLQRQHDEAVRRHAKRGIIDPALQEYRWMLEEFRISIFAQEIKALVPVSPQKLDAVWNRVRAG